MKRGSFHLNKSWHTKCIITNVDAHPISYDCICFINPGMMQSRLSVPIVHVTDE